METTWSVSKDTVDSGIIQTAWLVSVDLVISEQISGSRQSWPHCASPGPQVAPHAQSPGRRQPPVTLQWLRERQRE